MATAGKLQDDFLTCSVCMEVYQRPVTLTCQHSFCENCLGKYLQTKTEAVRNKSIPCPTCRQETPVPHPDRSVEEWAGQLKPGLLLTGLMDSITQGPGHCSVCRENGKTTPAALWCSDCEALFCDGCLKLHNVMPNLKKHKVVKCSRAKTPQKKKFFCSKHNENIKLYCKDCNKPLCTVCCSIAHRTCKEVITIKEQLPEVKSRLQESQHILSKKTDLKTVQIKEIDSQTKNLLVSRSILESNIRKNIKEAIDALKQKEDQLIKKVKDQTEQDKEQLRSMMKTKQMELELYQQQVQSIQQALELEDEAQLFEMYLSSGSGADITGAQRKDRTEVADISFKHDFAQLKEQIEMMDVEMNVQHIDGIVLTAPPVLDTIIDAKLNVRDDCHVIYGLVMNVPRTKVTLFADYNSQRLKSFYTNEGKPSSSALKVSGKPLCLTVISESKVAVSLPDCQCIITVAVTPELELLSTIQTSKNYRGLSTLDQSTLVAGSYNPSSVDLIDMKGTILKTFTTLPTIGQCFINPHFIHVTRQSTILVSDDGLKSVICLTQSGDIVFTYTPTGERALKSPWGITSTNTGEILVADHLAHKVIHLSCLGQFVRDILTAEDGLEYPTGLCIDGDGICVTLCNKALHKYKFH